jgi:two-component system sensor histidine kinase CreC
MRLLADYAQKITSGSRPSLPHLGLGREARILGDAIESMREKLEGREYAGQYVRTLTHELKSPLAAIQGASELLLEPMPEEQRAKFLGNIRLEAERAERMIRRLLRLSEVERMKSLQTTRDVPVCELMNAVAAEAQPLTSNRNITLEVIAPESEIMLSGSPELLHSALINLVENAIDFSPAGGRIEFRFVAPNRFQVTDEGPGIPDYAKPRLFERFYSLKQSQVGRRGTGLGLCFVKEVANLHGGDVTLENRADQPVKGAVATLSIGTSDQ